MSDETVQELVSRAVNQTFEKWAAEHPSLAAVIDRIRLTERAAESIRNSEDYRKAVASFYRARSETEFLGQLLTLAGPIVRSLLAG